MKIINKFTTLLLIISLVIMADTKPVNADSSIRKTVSVCVNGEETINIAALEVNYEDNIYISLKGLAYCLKDTAKAFNVTVEADEINVETGSSFYENPGIFTEEELKDRPKWKLSRTPFYIDTVERKYYSLVGRAYESDTYDAFLSPLRLAMALNLDLQIKDGIIYINTDSDFNISDAQLENSGYLQGINALLIGDALTGDIYFDHNGRSVVPIASTSKLMTYYVMMDAISNGEISLDDSVTISENVRSLSEGIDGLVSFEGISEAKLSDLIYAMLISSSNECALAIAEHVATSEELFVERMNAKVSELNLENAKFYNCNGLPVYEKQTLPAKMQNHMTATDMFTLTASLVNTYPEILNITSEKKISLNSLKYEAKNTNALLYNMDGVMGLKTGTTNKSGACLVVSIPVEKDGETHNLICVLFGAEGELDRALVAEIASRIAISKLEGVKPVSDEKYEIVLEDPEIDVQRMLRNL